MTQAIDITQFQGLSQGELIAKLAQMTAKVSAMQAASHRKLTLKVSDKGALSLYGMGRFPVTLYRGQWEKLLAEKEGILAFIQANADSLSVKE